MVPALASGRYHIKWTQLANLPAPIYGAYVTVQEKKIYVAGGASPVDDALHQVYVYDVDINQWERLPSSGHLYGIPHTIGGKLVVIGGRLASTKKRTNKVSTFDYATHTWVSLYPDLLSVRNRPGVVTHLEHVIVAGGAKGDDSAPKVQESIEVLNWIEKSHWRKVSFDLPVPMVNFTPIIADNHVLIVGFTNSNMLLDKSAFKIPIDDITRPRKQRQMHTKWITVTEAPHWRSRLIPSSSPPVAVGGADQNDASIPDIRVYDDYSKSWKTVATLSSARSYVAIYSSSQKQCHYSHWRVH